ncbi:MAG TPA: carbohydrate-binding family 9-like protein [Pyrinomonadaceae bacterium]|nr:carbohydrate-binding family 9-like protein [Pyrinomonadaceae bacterium]
MNTDKRFEIVYIEDELPIGELDNVLWQHGREIEVCEYWTGDLAPKNRRFSVRGLWSNNALFIRFEAAIGEAMIVNETPNLAEKTIGLWDRDVCEVFIAPNAQFTNKYFEFEIAPTGEWIDLALEVTHDGRKTDLDFASGMTSAVKTEYEKVVMAVRIPFSALGKTPKNGEVWLGNLFRCVGTDPNRGYLAWMPTMTEIPNFHVPERFGQFAFTRQ